LLLTAGVDVQKDRWAIIVLGWGRNGIIFVIDYYELPGDPTQPQDWLEVEKRIKEPFINAYGVAMRIEMTAVDSGFLQDDVVHFVRERQRRGWFATKGSTSRGLPIITRPSKIDYSWRGSIIKGGAQQWQVGVFNAKEWLFRRLAADRERLPEDRLIRFCAELGEDFYNQLTAEVFDTTLKRFVKVRERNEALDTFCYALAAGMHPLLRVHAWHEPRWMQREALLQPVTRDLFSEGQAPSAPTREKQSSDDSSSSSALSVQEMIRRAKAQLTERPS
jgi:phage terminase large subunit GpA-like protein